MSLTNQNEVFVSILLWLRGLKVRHSGNSTQPPPVLYLNKFCSHTDLKATTVKMRCYHKFPFLNDMKCCSLDFTYRDETPRRVALP